MMPPSTNSDSGLRIKILPYFLEQTKDRLTEIKVHQQAIYDGSEAFAAMKAINDVAHKISGTAETLGFNNLGAFARNIEALWSNRDQGDEDIMVLWTSMEYLISPLINEITRLLEPK